MSEITNQFIELVKSRSNENKTSIKLLFDGGIIGNCISILRQELDSFIRIIYLGRLSDMNERCRLMQQTLNGKKWTVLTVNNKCKKLTDRDMVNVANDLFGYIKYVYKFGCGFIHLSKNHNFQVANPFDSLDDNDRDNIKSYLNQYHEYPVHMELTVENFRPYILTIFEKISGNMLYHADELKEEKQLDF